MQNSWKLFKVEESNNRRIIGTDNQKAVTQRSQEARDRRVSFQKGLAWVVSRDGSGRGL